MESWQNDRSFPRITLDNGVMLQLEPGYYFDTHMHYTAELCLCTAGELTFQLYRNTISIHPGEYFLCYPNFLHSAANPGAVPARILQLHFSCAPESSPGTRWEGALAFDMTLGQRQYLKAPCCPGLQACIEGILRELASPDAGLILPSYLQQLDIFLSRDLAASGSAAEIYRNRYLMRACSYIAAHCSQGITVAETARAAGISERYLNRLFRDYFEISVYAYITHVRISKAIGFMRTHPGYPLAKLALDLGFSSQQHFSSVFKTIMSVSPKRYFSAHRNNF